MWRGRDMTSPSPISIWQDICSYCWKKLNPNEMIFIRFNNGDIHWACNEDCLKGMLEEDNLK